jgi:DNA-binding SARP family transcriptional activator
LLVLLLVNVGKLMSVDRLIGDLWSGSGSVKSAQVAVARLRSSLGGAGSGARLVTRERGYSLELREDDVIDQVAFERGVDEGRRLLREGQSGPALTCLADALELWRGPAFAGFSDEHWAIAEARRLEELRSLAFEAQVDAALALGRHDAMIPELERLTHVYPDRERVRAQLMLALYRAGRQSDALRAFRDARRHFIDEYGIEPGEALRTLNQSIVSQDPALLASRRSNATGLTTSRLTIPLPARLQPFGAAAFVGRERERGTRTTGGSARKRRAGDRQDALGQ